MITYRWIYWIYALEFVEWILMKTLRDDNILYLCPSFSTGGPYFLLFRNVRIYICGFTLFSFSLWWSTITSVDRRQQQRVRHSSLVEIPVAKYRSSLDGGDKCGRWVLFMHWHRSGFIFCINSTRSNALSKFLLLNDIREFSTSRASHAKNLLIITSVDDIFSFFAYGKLVLSSKLRSKKSNRVN